jgi:hypothetical protein
MSNPRTILRKKNGKPITIEVTLQNALAAFLEALDVAANKSPANNDLLEMVDRFRVLVGNVDWRQDSSVMTTRIVF